MTSSTQPIIVIVGGNIGSGKSSLLEEAKRKGYPVIAEPIDEWASMLVEMYKNNDSDSIFYFQSLVYAHYARITARLFDWLKTENAKMIFVERCPAEALHVFLPLNKKRFQTADYDALVQMHTRLIQHSVWQTSSMYCMLEATPKICQKRIALRARNGESAIAESYLEKIENLQNTQFIPSLPPTKLLKLNSGKLNPSQLLAAIECCFLNIPPPVTKSVPLIGSASDCVIKN